MKKILSLTSLFCISLLVTVSIDKNKTQGFKESREPEGEKIGDAETDEPLQFFKFHQGIRTAADERSPSYAEGHKFHEFNKAYQAAVARNKNSNNARTQGANGVIEFKERGPGNVPGRTRALLVLPSDATHSTWLAGAATGGIWKTTNGGTSWTEKSGNFPILPISSLAMSSVDNNIIYAGTGELVSSVYSAIGDGIFKSIDQGETWSQLASTARKPEFSIVTRIIVDPQNPNILLASGSRSNLSTDNSSSIMKSIDGGTSWVKVYETNRDIEQIIFTPGNFNIQYAAINRVGVLKSIDAGETWVLAKTGLSPNGRLEISVSPVDPNRLFASSEGSLGALSGTGSDLYMSDDAGATWNLVDVTFANKAVDFLQGQGNYDNTIACDPYNKNIIYVGGVSHFRITMGSGSTVVDNYNITDLGTKDFLFLNAFGNTAFFDGGKLQVGSSANKKKIEIRFGTNLQQKAHRFFVPDKKNSGVTAASYSYMDYVDVPFQVWDITTLPARQLMVSFRDQNRNGFDLIPSNLTNGDAPTIEDAFKDSREYVYIHNIDYSTTSSNVIGVSGGQETQLAYSFFPALAKNATWDPFNLPNSSLTIGYSNINKLSATTITVSDSRGTFDSKNRGDQVNQTIGVHADHHYTVMVPYNVVAKTYQVLLTTDGGVFASNVSTTPGIVQGDWQAKGAGYNTSQFYGADKKPGSQEYIGGMQDNGTRKSQSGQVASAQGNYSFALGGDGFEVAWHSLDGKKIIGSIYNNTFYRTVDGGSTWASAFSGFPLVTDENGNQSPDPNKYPFVTKIASSKSLPDELYAVGTDGVWKSSNFGGSWTLTPITQSWGANPFFFDVEVSRANANIVWAGTGMDASRKLHVSTNGGKTFSPASNFTTTTMGTITKFASHPTESNTAYALFSFANKPKILRTTDLGQTWQDISGFGAGTASINGFPDVAVYCLYVRPDDTNIIWAGTEIGIVESLDGGTSWALLNDNRFPNVSVWDMRGQDDEIVMATFGRGIWTAKAPASQGSVLKNPIVQSVSTSPTSKFLIQYEIKEDFDSIAVFINSKRSDGKINYQTAGTYIATISKVQPGGIDVRLIAYKGTSPIQSPPFTGTQLKLIIPYQQQYSNLFTSTTDLSLNGLSLQNFGSANQSLQSPHNYLGSKEYSALLLQPIIVSPTNSNFFYQDVALVQPSAAGVTFGQPAFKDYAVVEATKDGITWIPLKDGYNASSNANWLTAYNANQSGNPSLSVDQNIDLKTKFATNDTLLFRFRLKADADATTGWGWSIDNLFIQQTPTGIELESAVTDFSVYPNPTPGKIKILYTLREESTIGVEASDVNGKSVSAIAFGLVKKGTHEIELDLSTENTGIYLIKLKTAHGDRTSKILVRR